MALATQRSRVEEQLLVGVGQMGALPVGSVIMVCSHSAWWVFIAHRVTQLHGFNAWEWFSYSFYPSSGAESGLGVVSIQNHSSTPAFGSMQHKGSPQAKPCSAAHHPRHRLGPGQMLLGVEANSGCTGQGWGSGAWPGALDLLLLQEEAVDFTELTREITYFFYCEK